MISCSDSVDEDEGNVVVCTPLRKNINDEGSTVMRSENASYTLCIKLLVPFRRLGQTRIIEMILSSAKQTNHWSDGCNSGQ